MKTNVPILLILLCTISLTGAAQRASDLRAGIGWPYIFGNDTQGDDTHSMKGVIVASLEKPIRLQPRLDSKFTLNPGLGFFFLQEDEHYGGLGAGGLKDLNHIALNAYAKLLYRNHIQRRSEAFYYLGVKAGMNLWSQTTGIIENHSTQEDASNFRKNVKENASGVYDNLFFGLLAGYQPHAKLSDRFKPAFELTWYPSFIHRGDDQPAAVEISLFLGIKTF